MPAQRITRLLQQMNTERGTARKRTYDELVTLVYDDLKRRARGQLRGERADSLRPTVLVSQAYERMMNYRMEYTDSAHFMNVAATAMRRYLIDRARRVRSVKRGGRQVATTLKDDTAMGALAGEPELLLDIDRAMGALTAEEERLTELRFFVGFTIEEVAQHMGLGVETTKNRWKVARAKLLKALKEWQASGDPASESA